MTLKSLSNNPLSWPLIYLGIILLALLSGYQDIPVLKPLGLVIAEIFVKIFKCISLPIITLSIIVTLSQYSTEGSMRYVWRRTMRYTFITTFIAAVISALFYLFIHPSLVTTVDSHVSELPSQELGYWNYLINLIPSSFIEPFVKNQVMSALLVGVLTGIGIRFIPESELQHSIIKFFRAFHGLLMVITSWVIAYIPIALFGFITATVVQLKAGLVLKGIGEYLLVVVLANCFQGFVILPLWLKFNKIKPYKSMQGMLPALSVAFFSKSSVGALPVTIRTIEANLKVRPEISRFVMPLCTSLNMNGCAAFIFATVVYLMQNHGIELTLASMGMWVCIATIAAIGNAEIGR